MTNYQKLYFFCVILAVLTSFSPLKILSYFIPIILVAVFFFTEDVIIISKKIIILISIVFFMLFVYLLVYRNFITQNYFLSFLTYSTLYPIIFIDSKKLASSELLKKILDFVLVIFTIESIIGILQAINGFFHNGTFGRDNGDYVEGTIHIGFTPDRTFSNVMFASNMILIGICLLISIYLYGKRIKIRLLLGLLSIILASVVHAVLLIITSILISFFLIKPEFIVQSIESNYTRVNGKKYILILLLFGIITSAFFIGDDISQLRIIVNKTLLGEYPRAIVTSNVVYDIPREKPLAPIIGLGPGQFSSRASLIGSGLYLGGMQNPRSAPLLENKISLEANNFIVYLMVEWAGVQGLGSSQQPFYSLLSIYSEMGIVGILCLFIFSFKILRNARRNSTKTSENKFLCFIFFTGFLYIILLGVQENYYEVPQAIMVGVLILKVIYSIIVYKSPSNENILLP